VRRASYFVNTELGTDVRRMLAEAARIRGKRNGIIHSIWPNPRDDQAFAWRPFPPASQGQSPTKSFTTSRDEFKILIREMIKMIDEIARLTVKAQPQKSDRMNEGRPRLLPGDRKRPEGG
jgi:hypothetical protein